MSSEYKVEFSQRANAQIRSKFSYIAEDRPKAALRMVDRIEARAYQLANTPNIGVELPQNEYPFLQPGYRKLVVSPFIMYYRIVEKTVYITHIIHSRRNQANALTEKE